MTTNKNIDNMLWQAAVNSAARKCYSYFFINSRNFNKYADEGDKPPKKKPRYLRNALLAGAGLGGLGLASYLAYNKIKDSRSNNIYLARKRKDMYEDIMRRSVEHAANPYAPLLRNAHKEALNEALQEKVVNELVLRKTMKPLVSELVFLNSRANDILNQYDIALNKNYYKIVNDANKIIEQNKIKKLIPQQEINNITNSLTNEYIKNYEAIKNMYNNYKNNLRNASSDENLPRYEGELRRLLDASATSAVENYMKSVDLKSLGFD